MIKYLINIRVSLLTKYFNFFGWALMGICYLFYIQTRDAFLLIKHIFTKGDIRDDDFQRLKKNLNQYDFLIFSQFIHSPNALKNNKDVHTMFIAYLEYEAVMNDLNDDFFNYIVKFGKQSKFFDLVKQHQSDSQPSSQGANPTIFKPSVTLENRKFLAENQLERAQKTDKNLFYVNEGKLDVVHDHYKKVSLNISTAAVIKKNLMVIEILENFVADSEDVANSTVDVVKMRKLFPLNMNIRNRHYRRILNSHLKEVSLIKSKMNNTKINFMKYLLCNRIISSARRIDKGIDLELKYAKITNEHKKQIQNNNVKTIENNYNKDDIKVKKGYLEMIRKFKESVIKIIEENKLSHEENSLTEAHSNANSNSKISSFIEYNDEEKANKIVLSS